jgi:hypothetical protein
MTPGSYGDHVDPRPAMRLLAAEYERVTGIRVEVELRSDDAIEQFDEWCSDWHAAMPSGHSMSRHWANFCDIGIWPDE